MEIRIKAKDLCGGLDLVAPVVAGNPILPVLANVLFDAGEVFEVAGNNLERGIRAQIPASIGQAGAISVPFKPLRKLVQTIPGEEDLRLVVDGKTFRVQTPNGEFTWSGIPAEEFPDFPEPKGDGLSGVEELGRGVSMVSFAASRDTNRLTLQGIHWVVREGEMEVCATNGHVAGRIRFTGDFQGMGDAIFPLEVGRMIKGWVLHSAKLGGDTALLTFDKCVLYTRLLEGPYPDMNQVFAGVGSTRTLTANRAELASAFRRVGHMADRDYQEVALNFGDRLTLSAKGMEGEAEEEITDIEWVGEPFRIGFDARLALGVLWALDAERIRWTLDSPRTASKIEPVDGDKGYDAAYLLMPLRLD